MQQFNILFVTVTSLLYCCVHIFPEVVSDPFASNWARKNGVLAKRTNNNTSSKRKLSNDISKSEFEEHLEPLPDDPSDDNGDSGADETPDKLSPAVAKSTSIQTLLKERWSLETPSINKDMSIVRSYTFSMKFDKLQLNFIGSRYTCTVKIKCSSALPMNPDDFIQITDGLGGENIYSEHKKLRGYWKPSENGTDIYVRYKGKNPLTTCTASCTKDTDRYLRKLIADPSSLLTTPSSIDRTCECGRVKKKLLSKIIGGEEATPFEIPWQIALVEPGQRNTKCGASLINERYALSAAHCFEDSTPKEFEVLLHAHVLNQVLLPGTNKSIYTPYNESTEKTDADENSLRVGVEEIINHHLYDPDEELYDLALVRFKEKIDFSQHPDIKPICLEELNAPTDYSGKLGTVSGWGLLNENDTEQSSTLQKVSIKIFSRAVCGNVTYQSMICGGLKGGGKDSCQGDSGGPLTLKSNNKWRQIGVVSIGEGCGRANSPGFYSTVGEMRQWIQRMVHHDTKWCQE